MKELLLWCCLSGCCLSAVQAQLTGTLKGSVTDESGPIPFAHVGLLPAGKTTVADPEGKFQLLAVTPGDYQLVITAVGFRKWVQTVRIAANKNTELPPIQLSESTLGLDEVVVTGNLQEKAVLNSAVKVEVIPSEFLFKSIAPTNLMEGLSLINGVQEVVSCGVCFTNSISINGLPGPYTAVLMDGTPMFGNLASVYGLNGIPSQIIDRIEVIKGPNSTLYGSEAMAGVINIITKKAGEQPAFSLDQMITSHLESFTNATASLKSKRADGYVGVNYGYVNLFEDDNKDGFSDLVNFDRLSVFSKWNLKRKSGQAFTVAAKYYFEDRRNGVKEFLQNRNYRELRGSDSVYGESILTRRAELFGTYHLAGLKNVRSDFSFSHHQQDSYYGADHYVAEQQIGFANLIWQPTLGKLPFTIGTTLRYQGYDDNTLATEQAAENGTVSNQPQRQFIPGIFAQTEWAASSKWVIMPGLRVDHYEAHGPIFSPRMSLKFSPGQWSSFRLNTGTGFRVVNLFTEDHAFISGQREVEIAENLQPEKSVNLAVNFNHIYSAGNGQGMLDIDAYYTYFTNKIVVDYSQPQKIIYQNATDNTLTKGVSFSVNHNFMQPLSFTLGGNWQQVTQEVTLPSGERAIQSVPFAPQWSGNATLSYEWKRQQLSVSYTLQATGPMTLPEVYDLTESGETAVTSRPTQSEAFALHTLQVVKGWQKRRWELYAGIQNIFDFKQPYSPLVGYNDPNFATGFSPQFDTSYAYAPLHGREFYLGIRFRTR